MAEVRSPFAAVAATPAEKAAPAPGDSVVAAADVVMDRRLFSLPGDLLVLPGHGLDTTLDTERPHLQEWIDRGW